jgi:hypothetical protein
MVWCKVLKVARVGDLFSCFSLLVSEEVARVWIGLVWGEVRRVGDLFPYFSLLVSEEVARVWFGGK